MKKFFPVFVILLLLLGFPLGSYLYMKQGFAYRKKAIEAMGDFGPMPNLNALANLRGDLPDSLRGNMVVVSWLDPNEKSTGDTYGTMLDSLFQQCQNSPHLYFTTITTADSTYVAKWAENYALPEDDMLSFLAADSSSFQSIATDFALPEDPGGQPIVALVDSSLTIRKFYDLREREQTIGLVQLISLIIPLPERGDVIVAPQKEL
ncbi:MAG: hypothetical protein AAFU03_07900 [Bacteroidota bacterium]